MENNKEFVEAIKGLCENCGQAFMGKIITSPDGEYPDINCPACGKPTSNFDDTFSADEINREDASVGIPTPEYKDYGLIK